ADTEVDLQVFEPMTLPIRVLDADGKPVTSIRYELNFQTSSGRRFGQGDSMRLDAEGRSAISLSIPVAELTLQVAAFAGGPLPEPRRCQPSPGMSLAEETFVLERTCDLALVLLDPRGVPLADSSLSADITYGDGRKETVGIRTDSKGAFRHSGLRAAAM